MTLTQWHADASPDPSGQDEVRPSAVTWVNGRHAYVARLDAQGHVSQCEVERGDQTVPAYLADVVRAIGDRERVVILGPGTARLALEREYVAIFHRPDRLVDVERAGPVSQSALVERLHTLAR